MEQQVTPPNSSFAWGHVSVVFAVPVLTRTVPPCFSPSPHSQHLGWNAAFAGIPPPSSSDACAASNVIPPEVACSGAAVATSGTAPSWSSSVSSSSSASPDNTLDPPLILTAALGHCCWYQWCCYQCSCDHCCCHHGVRSAPRLVGAAKENDLLLIRWPTLGQKTSTKVLKFHTRAN